MLAIPLFILAALPLILSGKPPICSNPLPPAPFIPSTADCHDLVADIRRVAQLEDNEPITWSNSTSAPAGVRKLPYSFKGPQESNTCEFIVDAFRGDGEDTFPTGLIAEGAAQIVKKCMDERTEGQETLGAVSVGPKRVIGVISKRIDIERTSMSGVLNGTKVTLLGPGSPVSGPGASVIEDG